MKFIMKKDHTSKVLIWSFCYIYNLIIFSIISISSILLISDNTLANAILDRLLHHSSIIKITGPSYRLKGKIEEVESRVKNS